jgi:pyruvate/2-oxoglutarate dehydrogenase complex dihydrolipoamide dehydrogenase (E3) component
VTTGRQVPFCLFLDPEFARVGLSEKEAKAPGIAYRFFKIPIEGVLRARTLSETRGFLKALVEINSDRILVFTAFAVDGGEIMSSVQIATNAGLPYTALRDTILTHPTLAQGLARCSHPNLRRRISGRERLLHVGPLKLVIQEGFVVSG